MNKDFNKLFEINLDKNNLISGDNLDWLPLIPDESIDLCYIDPPFFSNQNYEVIWGNSYETRSFGDRFAGGINHYIDWMKERVVLIHKKLKTTGSFYLHCDWHASHYLKVMCDDLFGYKNFRNEIVWEYQGSWIENHGQFPKRHGIILFYTKSDSYSLSLDNEDDIRTGINFNRWYKYIKYNKIYANNAPFHDRRFDIYVERFIKKYNRKPKGKDVIIDFKGALVGSVWYIKVVDPKSKERIGYKTQKPEALLKRILQASSNEGNVVLDCFAGGGTTAKICADLDRVFICGDVSPVAVRVIASRLNKYCPKVDYQIQGLPKTEKELKAIDGHHFATLVCRCKGWDVNTKKSDDAGIDGWANNKKVPIQIKNHLQPIGRPDIQKFAGAMRGQPEGIFVAWDFSKKAIEYIANLKKDEGKSIKIINCYDIFKDILISEDKQKKLDEYYLKQTKGQLELGM